MRRCGSPVIFICGGLLLLIFMFLFVIFYTVSVGGVGCVYSCSMYPTHDIGDLVFYREVSYDSIDVPRIDLNKTSLELRNGSMFIGGYNLDGNGKGNDGSWDDEPSIVFSDDGDKVIHRALIEVYMDGESLGFISRGDNNMMIDQARHRVRPDEETIGISLDEDDLVSRDEFIGVSHFSVGYIGHIYLSLCDVFDECKGHVEGISCE